MSTRTPVVFLGVALVACTTDVTETVRDGHVRQHVDYAQYRVEPRLDVVVVVNTGDTDVGTTLRESVAAGLAERARSLAEGDRPWLRHLWNPIDARAVVAGPGGIAPPLEWLELDATNSAAESFAATAREAIALAAETAPRTEGVVTALHDALTAAATPADARRLIVIVSTEDDATARAAADPLLRPLEDALIVLVPDESSAPNLQAWARSNDGLVKYASSPIGLQTTFADHVYPCLERARSATRGAPHCRVRAFVPPGTTCDPARGWRPSASASPSPLKSELAGMDACEIAMLDDLHTCESGDRRRASGWCLPEPVSICASPSPRLVGGAAPPWATIEIACNLDE